MIKKLLAYTGKIRGIMEDEVEISLWYDKKEEIRGYLARNYFPEEIKVGAVFKYNGKKVKMVFPKQISESELKRMADKIDRELGDLV